MEKIKLSNIKNVPEFRTVVSTQVDGKIQELYVLNPKGELFDEMYEVISSLLEMDSYTFEDGSTVTEENLMSYMIEKLTNIDVDINENVTLDDNISFLEIVSAIQEIHSEFIIKAQINLTNFYNLEKQRYHALQLEKAFTSFVEQKEANDKEEKELNNKK